MLIAAGACDRHVLGLGFAVLIAHVADDVDELSPHNPDRGLACRYHTKQ